MEQSNDGQARRQTRVLSAGRASEIRSTSAGAGGRLFAHLFARRIDARSALADAVRFRLGDRNLTDAERSRVARLAERS